jgi:hypothetical protein
MLLVKAMHKQEAKMYPHSYHWTSQTNEVRLQKMIRDNHLESMDQCVFHVMPNYPSQFWAKSKTNYGISKKIRLVYVGSLGYDTTYLKELTEWAGKNESDVTLDLYSHNIDEKAKSFLSSVNTDGIQFRGSINYSQLPEVLTNYDVGLVIYKPVSDNWIYNAPNKVFEYLACGLDVWFSKTMTYAMNLTTDATYPKIIAVDFDKLEEFDLKKAINRDGLSYRETGFFYENVYHEICGAISE